MGAQDQELRTVPLVADVTQSYRNTNLVVAWVVAFGVGVILMQVAVQPIVELIDGGRHTSFLGQVGEVITNGAGLLVLLLWMVLWERRSFWSAGMRGPGGLRRFVAGFGIGLVWLSIPIVALWIAGSYRVGTSEHTVSGGSAVLLVLATVPIWIVQGSTEEILIRGYLFQWHGWKLRPWLAIAITSAVFALAHLDFHPIVLANLALAGVLFTFLSLATGSIWLACGLHAAWNLTQGNIFGLPVSGLPRDVALLTLGPSSDAPGWITGGGYGIEGSALLTLWLALACLVAWRWWRRVQADRAGSPIPVPRWTTRGAVGSGGENPQP